MRICWSTEMLLFGEVHDSAFGMEIVPAFGFPLYGQSRLMDFNHRGCLMMGILFLHFFFFFFCILCP